MKAYIITLLTKDEVEINMDEVTLTIGEVGVTYVVKSNKHLIFSTCKDVEDTSIA